jgi:hypothetical protein
MHEKQHPRQLRWQKHGHPSQLVSPRQMLPYLREV